MSCRMRSFCRRAGLLSVCRAKSDLLVVGVRVTSWEEGSSFHWRGAQRTTSGTQESSKRVRMLTSSFAAAYWMHGWKMRKGAQFGTARKGTRFRKPATICSGLVVTPYEIQEMCANATTASTRPCSAPSCRCKSGRFPF